MTLNILSRILFQNFVCLRGMSLNLMLIHHKLVLSLIIFYSLPMINMIDPRLIFGYDLLSTYPETLFSFLVFFLNVFSLFALSGLIFADPVLLSFFLCGSLFVDKRVITPHCVLELIVSRFLILTLLIGLQVKGGVV